MSKIDDLRAKYKLLKATFNKIIEGDTTPTKKYCEYMLKCWANRNSSRAYQYTLPKFIKLAMSFETYLPYIENKDIYSKVYNDVKFLEKTINDAIFKKEDKEFKREEHVYVLYESDEVLMVAPKTYKGSKKYGYGTRWCTTMNASTFNSYNNGSLVYIIDKTETKKSNSNKIAFFKNTPNKLNDGYHIFNSYDTYVDSNLLVNNGWDVDLLFNLNLIYLNFINEHNKYSNAKNGIKKLIKTFETIDFDKLKSNMLFVMDEENKDLMKKTNVAMTEFVEKLKNYKF